MADHEFKIDDRVRCISRDNTYRGNRGKIGIDNVYTVQQIDELGGRLILQEVEDLYATSETFGYYFDPSDFVPADELTIKDINDAWNRAMGVL